jgi:hypothetical protein
MKLEVIVPPKKDQLKSGFEGFTSHQIEKKL